MPTGVAPGFVVPVRLTYLAGPVMKLRYVHAESQPVTRAYRKLTVNSVAAIILIGLAPDESSIPVEGESHRC